MAPEKTTTACHTFEQSTETYLRQKSSIKLKQHIKIILVLILMTEIRRATYTKEDPRLDHLIE